MKISFGCRAALLLALALTPVAAKADECSVMYDAYLVSLGVETAACLKAEIDPYGCYLAYLAAKAAQAAYNDCVARQQACANACQYRYCGNDPMCPTAFCGHCQDGFDCVDGGCVSVCSGYPCLGITCGYDTVCGQSYYCGNDCGDDGGGDGGGGGDDCEIEGDCEDYAY